jgi:hypothetical protein
LVLVAAVLSSLTTKAVSGAGKWPFPYDKSKFPVAWFGSNATNWESDAQIEAIGKYSMAILGWQHLTTLTNFTAVVYEQITQVNIIKARHPKLPVFVYAGFGWAMGLNAGVLPILNDPAFKDYFLQSKEGYVFTQTDCQQGHTSPSATDGRCIGHFWNFANDSAADYFIEHIVRPLAVSPIDGVFFDATNYGYDIPEVHPWNRLTINVPNCTFPAGEYSGCEALVKGTLDVAKRTTELLNKYNKVPMFANPGSFVKPERQHIWLNESRLVEALDGMAWFTYYESARAESMLSSGNLPNMLEESKLGVASVVHTYYHNATEDPLPHMAAFMLAKEENWYFLGSTGWWDDSYAWDPLYDKLSQCGQPLSPSTRTQNSSAIQYGRNFEHCKVELTCTNDSTTSTCTGGISFDTESYVV